MKKTRRTKITVETERLLVVSRGRGQVDGWCEICRAEVRLVGVEEAALVAGLGQRAIFRRIESGRLHFTETSRGALLICLESLLQQTRAGESE
ncbi:MAG TPA: hypothetical protein VGB17_15110 [Pyrinomonadaceae bacterium]|jgi:hypothetical protein